MKVYILRRLLLMIVFLLILSLFSFFIISFSPLDPVAMQLVRQGIPPDAAYVAVKRAELGLDQPILIQYFHWLSNMLQGNLGTSMFYGVSVESLLIKAILNTLLLTVTTLLFSLVITVPLSILAFKYQNSVMDYTIRFFSFICQAMPTFWLALLLIYFVSVQWGLLPIKPRPGLQGLILPTITLGIWMAGMYIRRLRVALLEEGQREYVIGAKVRGISDSKILWQYIFPQALPPILTMLGLTLGQLLGGAAVAETIFGWHGMGELMIEAILNHDYIVMQAYILWGGFAFVLINIITDCISLYLKPRRGGAIL